MPAIISEVRKVQNCSLCADQEIGQRWSRKSLVRASAAECLASAESCLEAQIQSGETGKIPLEFFAGPSAG